MRLGGIGEMRMSGIFKCDSVALFTRICTVRILIKVAMISYGKVASDSHFKIATNWRQKIATVFHAK